MFSQGFKIPSFFDAFGKKSEQQIDQEYEKQSQIFSQKIQDLKILQYPQQKSRSFFLFINSSSGGGVGTSMLQQQIQKIRFILPLPNTDNKEFQANVYFYNLRKKKEQGFKKLKYIIQVRKQKPIVVICGGDGTVMWIVHQLANHSIDPSKLSLAVIPLGTGNDFSRYLGWGPEQKTLIQNNYSQLKKLIFLWATAQEQLFDLWDVQAQATQKGYFQKVQNQKDSKLEGKYLYKTFCNYFSFGIDGQIGYSFDKCRTKSRTGNLMMYGALGMKQTISNPPPLNEVVSCLKTIQLQENPSKLLPCAEINKLMKEGKLIMATDSHPSHSERKVTSSFFNILALNINSYMGGTKEIWNNAGSGVYSCFQQMKKFHPQRSDDQKIQIVAFKSGAGLAVQKIIPGNADKIAQGKGPFVFDFYQYPLIQEHRTFLQIDGQFIRFTHPKRIVIKHSTLVPQGKIRVLKTNQLSIDSPLKIKLQWKNPFKI